MLLLFTPLAMTWTACATSTGITRERAIEIARQHVSFEPRRIEALEEKEDGLPVWRVTFYGEPMGRVRPMGEVMIVTLDRKTGEVVSLSRS